MVWRQLRDHVLRFALACWALGLLALGVAVVLLLSNYCTHPPILTG